MTKRLLTEEEKAAIRSAEAKKFPGETIIIKDETDENGAPQVGRIKTGPAKVLPKGWKPGDPVPEGLPDA